MGVGVIKRVGVGVMVGVMAVLGIGIYLAARTPTRIPNKIKAITMKNVFKKPDFLDWGGVSGSWRGDTEVVNVLDISGCGWDWETGSWF